jgi:hypothetical protein
MAFLLQRMIIVARHIQCPIPATWRRTAQSAISEGMPITPYLSGQVFEPELIREMSLALESVCETLKLRLTDDPNTRLVASKIIELAQRGVRDAPSLRSMTLKEFKHY